METARRMSSRLAMTAVLLLEAGIFISCGWMTFVCAKARYATSLSENIHLGGYAFSTGVWWAVLALIGLGAVLYGVAAKLIVAIISIGAWSVGRSAKLRRW